MMYNANKKGFTLVELLIVIAILAVLAVSLALVINPGELLAQARDGQRMNDLTTVRDALMLFLINSPHSSFPSCVNRSSSATAPTAQVFATTSAATTAANTRLLNGDGWVSVNLSLTHGGSPIPVLPVDPINNGVNFFAFTCTANSSHFELATRLESARHRVLMPFDGGNRDCLCNTAACTTANASAMTLAEAQAANCAWEIGSLLTF